jgi:hypothetical protein
VVSTQSTTRYAYYLFFFFFFFWGFEKFSVQVDRTRLLKVSIQMMKLFPLTPERASLNEG